MKKNSQIWSLDSIIASVIFVTSIVVFILIITTNNSKTTHEDIEKESSKINQLISRTDSGVTSFLIGPNIDIEKLSNLQKYNYTQLKSTMAIRSDFCIYFEDMEGNIINISNYTGAESFGLGHNLTKLGNNPCGVN
jgi:hypothetical protein